MAALLRQAATAVAAPDAGTPAPATSAPATAAPVGKRTKRPIADLEREFRDMIIEARKWGWPVAADNLEHWLDGHGATRAVPLTWLRGYGPVTHAESKNHERFEVQLDKNAESLADGIRAPFDTYWDAKISAHFPTDLYFASGLSQLKSTGSFALERSGSTVTITGTVEQRWFDPYDWNPGMFALVPGFGFVSDNVGLDLKDAGLGQDYLLENTYAQSVNGMYSFNRYLPDSGSYTWSGP